MLNTDVYSHMWNYLQVSIYSLSVVIFCFRKIFHYIVVMISQRENNLRFNYLYIDKILWYHRSANFSSSNIFKQHLPTKTNKSKKKCTNNWQMALTWHLYICLRIIFKPVYLLWSLMTGMSKWGKDVTMNNRLVREKCLLCFSQMTQVSRFWWDGGGVAVCLSVCPFVIRWPVRNWATGDSSALELWQSSVSWLTRNNRNQIFQQKLLVSADPAKHCRWQWK